MITYICVHIFGLIKENKLEHHRGFMWRDSISRS